MTENRRASAPDGLPRILVCSPIPVTRVAKGFESLDLWARDVNAQSKLAHVTLLCAVSENIPDASARLNPDISIIAEGEASTFTQLSDAIARTDYIQLPGNGGWRAARQYEKIFKLAKRHGKPVFLGISSNRARTNIINAQNGSLIRKARARVNYLDIRMTQMILARRCCGVFLVGEGLRKLVEPVTRNIHVGVASWIQLDDLAPPRARHEKPIRLCMAGRLEQMKGFHIGIAAYERVQGPAFEKLTIIGAGAEHDSLCRQAEKAKLRNFNILPPVSYPDAFFDFLDGQDIVLMTNLNDEQPRLIFDAISRGCIALCPDSPPYRALNLDPRIFYKQGDANALAERLTALTDPDLRVSIAQSISATARSYTLPSMHAARLDWMKKMTASNRVGV